MLGYSFPWFKNDENEVPRVFTYAIQSGIHMVTKSGNPYYLGSQLRDPAHVYFDVEYYSKSVLK